MVNTRVSLVRVSSRRSHCCPLLLICRVVMVFLVLLVLVVFALRGYSPEIITDPVLVLMAGAIAAADQLVGVWRVRAASALAQ